MDRVATVLDETGLWRDLTELPETLAATLDWSYCLLPPDEAAVLRAVSVFAGVLRLEDARAIANRSLDDTATK